MSVTAADMVFGPKVRFADPQPVYFDARDVLGTLTMSQIEALASAVLLVDTDQLLVQIARAMGAAE